MMLVAKDNQGESLFNLIKQSSLLRSDNNIKTKLQLVEPAELRYL